jgi:hypothetical protein
MEQTDRREGFDEEKSKIIRLLLDCGIDISAWGIGDAKTVDQLVKEIISYESSLDRTETGELVRSVEVAQGIITYIDENGDKLQLVEEKQVFNDGRVRVRDHLSDISVSEKMKPREDPLDALLRGMMEELEIEEGMKIAENPEVDFKDEDSLSYPGLRSQYRIYTFAVELDPSAYIPEGYAEWQEDKTNYFVWKKVDSED